MRANPEWKRLKVVGEGWSNYLSRIKTYIDLRGGLLAIHEVAPGRFSTTYFSENSIQKSHRKRRDGTLLIRAAGAALAGFFVFLLLMLVIESIVTDEALKNAAISVTAIGMLALVTLYSLASIVRFLFRRPTTRLIFNSQVTKQGLEFWHTPGSSLKLDRIVESIGNTRELAGEQHSVSIAHDWSYVYPFKNAVLLTISLFLLILFLGNRFERLLERYALELFYIVWLSLPPVVGVIYYLRARFRLNQYHGKSRVAIEKFVLGDYRSAEKALRNIIEANSKDEKPLALLMHVYIESDEFAKAARCVDFLESMDDDSRYEATKDIDLVRTWREVGRSQ